jgi:hypothetical protein
MHSRVLYLGYPPPDHAAREFLTKKVLQSESYHHACCFIEALFEHTLLTLRSNHFEADWDVCQVAAKFRSLTYDDRSKYEGT